MRTCLKLLLLLPIFTCLPLAAEETARTTDSVNVRAGPDKMFPTVTWLLSGTSVGIHGCTANWRWCDVTAGRERGWVYARFLSYRFNGTAVTIVNGGPNLGLPQAEFVLGTYWDAHYQSQHWYGRKAYWQGRWDRAPAPREWREPRAAPG